MKKLISYLLILSLLFSSTLFQKTYTAKSTEESEDALLLKIKAHSYINDVDTVDQLKDMRDAYEKTYERLLKNTSGDLKLSLTEQRDSILKLYDQKIEDLSILERRRKRNRGIGGVFRRLNSFLKNGTQKFIRGGKWLGDNLGKGIAKTIKTVVESLPTRPKDILTFILEYGSGSFSIRKILKNFAVNTFKKDVENQVFSKIMQLAKDPQLLEAFIELNNVTGDKLNIDDGFLERYKSYINEQESNDDDDDDDMTGGIDDDDDELLKAFENDDIDYVAIFQEQIDSGYLPFKLEGTYTLKSYNLSVPSYNYLYAYYKHLDYLGPESEANESIEYSTLYFDAHSQLIGAYAGQQIQQEDLTMFVRPQKDSLANLVSIYDMEKDNAHYIYKYVTWSVADTIDYNLHGETFFGSASLDVDWETVPITVYYNTTMTIDADGYLHISGDTSIKNYFMSVHMDIEEDSWGAFICHMVEATIQYNFVSDQPIASQ